MAPVAALAEPATLLERRIDAMTAPVRAWDRRVALGAMAALSLVGVACWTPRPEVAPRTRIAALVNELNSLLASDSAQRALSDAERDSVARVRERANAAQEPADSVHDDGTAPSRSSHVPAARRYGDRVDSLARAEYPRAFHTRDNAIVVVVLFDTADRIVRSYAKEFPREQVFDVLPGTTGLAQMRAMSYLVARTVPLPAPRLLQSGGTNSYEAPNAIFVWVKVGSGPLPASEIGRDSPDTPQQAPDAAVASRNVDVMGR